MAPRAPRPGTTPTSKPKGFKGFKITLDDDLLALDFRDIGATDEQRFESQTRKTLSEVVSKLDHIPNLAAIVWFARLKRGERKLNYANVLREFPSRSELEDMNDDGRFDIDFLDGTEPDEGEVSASDPLPSDDA